MRHSCLLYRSRRPKSCWRLSLQRCDSTSDDDDDDDDGVTSADQSST